MGSHKKAGPVGRLFLSLALPEKGAVGGQFRAAAKVMGLPGNEVDGPSAAGVEVGGVRGALGIDGHQNPLAVTGALKDDLLVG